MANEKDYFDWKVVADGVVEVSVHAGINLNSDHIRQAFKVVAAAMPEHFCVLAQRHENYKQSLEAMVLLSSIESVLLHAVYGLNEEQLKLAKTHKKLNPKVRVFNDRQSALDTCIATYKAHER